MTAPAAAGAVHTALRRADHGWCRTTADELLEPARLDHLAHAVQDRLGAWAAAPAAEVEQLRAALASADQRREDLRVELWKHIEVQERRAERAEHQRNTWKGEHDRLAAQLADAQRDALVVVAEALQERDAARADHDRHRHAWQWQPGLKALPLPCSCGTPWPRSRTPGGA